VFVQPVCATLLTYCSSVLYHILTIEFVFLNLMPGFVVCLKGYWFGPLVQVSALQWHTQ